MKKDKIPPEIVKKVNELNFQSISSELVFSLIKPGIALKKSKTKEDIPIGSSKYGGCPDLPDSIKWPVMEFEEEEAKIHLPFIMQLNFKDIKQYDICNLLPEEGMLYFFCEPCPDEIGKNNILYYTGDETLNRQKIPEDIADDNDDWLEITGWLEIDSCIFSEYPLDFVVFHSFPDTLILKEHGFDVELDEVPYWDLFEFLKKLTGFDRDDFSQLLGWPDMVTLIDNMGEKEILFQINANDFKFEFLNDGVLLALISKDLLLIKDFNNVNVSQRYS